MPNETAKANQLDQIMNQNDKMLVALLQEMIKIPSWVSQESEDAKRIHNENKVVDFLESWARENTDMDITRQKLEGGRYNLILSKGKPDLVLFRYHAKIHKAFIDVRRQHFQTHFFALFN